jgi:hypothetical protein
MLTGVPFQSTLAQDRAVGLIVNTGVMSRGLYPSWLTVGCGVDVHLNRHLMLRSEIEWWNTEIDLKSYYLVPSATLNVKVKRFFIGAGVLKRRWVSIWGNEGWDDLEPKLNFGIRGKRIRLTIVTVHKFKGNSNWWGIRLGVGF